ncbi:Oidioi.mRNA.OKI2018_I69.chr1.g975.t1.cds [Oikopleura dioica]|nr:Oidioi.mRNA.OKI2018_I69.chr1.g975.t1.cds [Oikopleura dioica]
MSAPGCSLPAFTCSYHGPKHIADERLVTGDLICKICGLVVGERCPPLNPEKSMRVTAIKPNENLPKTFTRNNEETGDECIISNEAQLSNREKNRLQTVLRECEDLIEEAGARLIYSGLTNTKLRAYELIKKLYLKEKQGTTWYFHRQNRAEPVAIAACLYLASKQENCDLSLEEICQATGTSP